jgi:hypothetical protein
MSSEPVCDCCEAAMPGYGDCCWTFRTERCSVCRRCPYHCEEDHGV